LLTGESFHSPEKLWKQASFSLFGKITAVKNIFQIANISYNAISGYSIKIKLAEAK